NGKIVEISKDIKADDTEIIDATGKEIYPGFIDAHCHVGMLDRFGQGRSTSDHNERNDMVSPHLRGIDAVDPMDENFEHGRLGGVTTVCTGPGSLNAMGGTFVALKTIGRRVDDMVVKNDVAMKCAFGENVRNGYQGKCASSRMTIAASLRDILSKAKVYMEKLDIAGDDVTKMPPFDLKLHSLLPVMRGEMPLKAHAHQAYDFFTAIRIAKEFGLRITLEHVTEGHLVAEELAQEGLYIAVGPNLSNSAKYEMRNKSFETPAVLSKAGCHVCIITDSPVIGLEQLPVSAGYAVKAGMDPFEALKAITIYAAEHIGIEDRVGSIEVGKDADIVITNGCPFEVSTVVEAVFIDGKKVK
ncbi:MAG: amidohydrolase, partial [Clostridia bacterium]|nr:amidohydrolase [Clostridia bacterium]